MQTLHGYYALQTVFTWYRLGSHIMNHWTRLTFCDECYMSDTITNMSSIFGVHNGYKVNMSNFQVSYYIELIFTVQWIWLSVLVLWFSSYTVCNASITFGVWKDYNIHVSLKCIIWPWHNFDGSLFNAD